jgi:hypothetical protein
MYKSRVSKDRIIRPNRVFMGQGFKKPKVLLELFKGTGSVGKVAEKKGFKVISLDFDKKFNPDILTDILKWDYKKANIKPDVIWASPPCTEFSVAKTTAPRDFKLADAIVKRVLEIIAYFKPKFWFIENPRGLLQNRNYMKALDRYKHTITYCSYDKSFPQKPTQIWTNCMDWDKRYETKENPCENAFINPKTGKLIHNITVDSLSLCDRYRIPSLLVNTLLDCM